MGKKGTLVVRETANNLEWKGNSVKASNFLQMASPYR